MAVGGASSGGVGGQFYPASNPGLRVGVSIFPSCLPPCLARWRPGRRTSRNASSWRRCDRAWLRPAAKRSACTMVVDSLRCTASATVPAASASVSTCCFCLCLCKRLGGRHPATTGPGAGCLRARCQAASSAAGVHTRRRGAVHARKRKTKYGGRVGWESWSTKKEMERWGEGVLQAGGGKWKERGWEHARHAAKPPQQAQARRRPPSPAQQAQQARRACSTITP